MDFHSLPRKDLQFFCKKNQIPANMTNIAMADALKALEIVEGIEEFANRSPTSVAKNLPSAARTAARRKTGKDETKPSELVTRSCYVTSKSLAGETDQENRNTLNVIPQSRRRAAATTTIAMNLEEEATNMKPETKTPAARSTRRTQAAAASCKKDESVQRAYSTRRSVKLLEESMADLSLITAKKNKNEDVKREDSSAGSKIQAKSEKTEEVAEATPVRDLNGSMEKEWDNSSGMKNDPDLDVLYGDLGDITFSDANMMNTTIEDETSQEDDFVVVDHAASSTKNQESETEESEAETEYEANDDSGVVVAGLNQEAFGSKVDSVTTVLVTDESKELDSEEDEMIDSEADIDEWSETDFEIESESEDAPVSDKKNTAVYFSSNLAGKETKTPLSPFQNVDLVVDNKHKNKEENVEMVFDNNEEAKSEADTTKKMNDEEKLKDLSMRQLTKMVKELAIKSKQRPHPKYLK